MSNTPLFMDYIFFIHSSVSGYIGCFQVFANRNKNSMNIVNQVFLYYDWASFDDMPNSCVAGSWGWFIPNFVKKKKNTISISKVTMQDWTLISSGRMFSLLYNFSNISCHYFFHLNYSEMCKMVSQLCFDFDFPEGKRYSQIP